ncbi:hypothetical protein B0O99DRAFT_699490 [Bisporella sp. PMI_857]|nr:hypothetical protein B0O99DRAFT_699490 [Bisporella sp. PMI_857]
MWFSFRFLWLLCFSSLAFTATTHLAAGDRGKNLVIPFDVGLKSLLSATATITHNGTVRWSEFDAPTPGTIVNVATEKDVQVTIKYCVSKGVPFLAQNGGHGWINSFNLKQNGVVVNLRGLNAVEFNRDRTQVTLQGGASVGEVINAAYANNAQVLTGNCNCVGTLGAALGGGYGNLLGLHGLSIDNFLSMNVVIADGSLITVTPAVKDLWWALRGAGPNFGIVTSAVMKSLPVPQAENTAWLGGLFFTGDQVEAVAQAIEDLVLQPKMNIFQYYLTTGAPDFMPAVLVTPFFYGSEADGRAAFASIIELGPFLDTTAQTAYPHWNDGAASFCVDGGRKPAYSAGFQKMVSATWRAIWNEFITFLEYPGTGSSVVILEAYPTQLIQSIPASTASFANRDIRFNSIVLPWYNNKSLDAAAEKFGSTVRDLWRSTSGLSENRTYINFAHGDEPNDVVYFSNTARLRSIKKKYDPKHVFSHWLDIEYRK